MNFTVNTKPLQDSVDFGVINSNISKLYTPSVLAEITASGNELFINLETTGINTKIILVGSNDSKDKTEKRFVSCQLLKQLVSTFEASTTTFEFVEGGIILHNGSTKITLPKIMDAEFGSLQSPEDISEDAIRVPVDAKKWAFVKDKQLYAIATTMNNPIYMLAWVGMDGTVLVGDFDIGLFTKSDMSNLGLTCLLDSTIINLLASIPDNSELVKMEDSFILNIKQDSYEIVSQFYPKFEDEGNYGNYNSDIIMNMISDESAKRISFSTLRLMKILNQADILSNSNNDIFVLSYANGKLHISNTAVKGDVEVESGDLDSDFELTFVIQTFKKMLSRYDDSLVTLRPIMRDDELVGVVIEDEKFSSMLAGVE